MEYKCDQCEPNKFFKTKDGLRQHEKRMHPDIPVGTPNPAEVETPNPAADEVFEVKPPEKKDTPAKPGTHHCLGCGAPVSKGQSPCPGCGEALNWEGIE